MPLTWKYEQDDIDWEALSYLYKIAPLGEKKAGDLQTAFSNSRYKCFIFCDSQVIGVGRALADGVDCSYICDVAVHPDHQGTGLGRRIVQKLTELSKGHAKIILYANPGRESFYKKLGFKKMNTAMAIFRDEKHALDAGLISEA